ncbi:Vacuolar protein sorting-associated protein 41 -like protein [Toxocara canis]|uniref:Vacuolar protein sorting-associated protein 41-like protein n=1 Tax=Toxocara canis TaxID=6265 RepID=A0A0B2UYA5_TOXCA|nr:Vacuolar protein sorting-associated protein 41 -like protein [Toxocara canis]
MQSADELVSDDGIGAKTAQTIEDEEDEEEVLLEPRFTYSRILNSIPTIFAKDAASCLAVHDKFIAIGTQMGYIYIFDHLGNLHSESTARHHRCAVAAISVDLPGSYIASCALDARISIHGIGADEFTQIIDLKVAARSVVISPDFSKRGSGQMFVTGERDLLLHERRFFATHKYTSLYQGLERDGIISQISWRGPCIAFTNETGTRIYDRNEERMIALVQPIHDVNSVTGYRSIPSHCWLNDHTLAIGWADTVCICVILPTTQDQTSTSSASSRSPTRRKERTSAMRKVEVHYAWRIDMVVADVSFTLREGETGFWKEIVVFGMKRLPSEKDEETIEMELALLEPEGVDSYVLNTEDRIEMRNCTLRNLQHFHMRALPLESLFFLLGPHEFIQAQPCSADERVRWYMENGMLKEAVEYANEHESQLEQLNALHIGKAYIDSLIAKGRYHEAAANLRTVCGRHKDQWEYYVNEFERHNVVLQVAKYLPVKDPQLEPESYQSVLIAALYNHPLLFHGLIKAWSPELYRVGAIIDMAMKRVIQDTPSHPLSAQHIAAIYRALAILHTHERKYDKALMLYIRLNDKTVFQVIERYRLFDLVKNDISKLMEVDADLAIRLVIENASSLPARTVLTQIAKYPKLQMAYLNRLLERNEGDEFANLAVRLYAEHDPKKLLPFLRKKQCYDITKALEICERKQYIKEMVFLLGRSGNYSKALDLLMNKLDRLDLAIDFCRENDDRALWEALIESSMSRPQRITQLLNTAGEYISPLEVVEKIPQRMVIPGLRDSLTKILHDFELQLQMQAGCRSVMLDSTDALLRRFLAQCTQPSLIDSTATCVLCSSGVMCEQSCVDEERVRENVIAFGCGHLIHQPCVERTANEEERRSGSWSIDTASCPNCRPHKGVKVIDSSFRSAHS